MAQLIGRQPSRRGIEVISAVARSDDVGWSSEALAWASWATTYLDLGTAGDLAARSAARAAGDRDQAYARWAAGWVHAYRHQEAAALGCLDQVISYAQAAAEPWLEASAWQARGRAADAFRDLQQVYERMQGRLEAARDLLDGALTVFRQAGDFRCVTRTLLELAEHHRPGDPEAAADLLLQGLGMAMVAGGASLGAQILASLTTAAAAAGDLPLAARALGALDALDLPQSEPGHAGARAAAPPDLVTALYAPGCATYLEEGRAGGISLIVTLYPR